MVDGDAVASLKRFFSVSHDAPPPGSARARPPPPPGTAAAPNFEGFCERKQQIAGAILKQRGDDMNSTRFHLVHEVRRRIIFDRGRRRSIRCPSTSLVNGRNRAFDRGVDISRCENGCLLWFGELVDIKKVSPGQDVYTRLASSEIGSRGRK